MGEPGLIGLPGLNGTRGPQGDKVTTLFIEVIYLYTTSVYYLGQSR